MISDRVTSDRVFLRREFSLWSETDLKGYNGKSKEKIRVRKISFAFLFKPATVDIVLIAMSASIIENVSHYKVNV